MIRQPLTVANALMGQENPFVLPASPFDMSGAIDERGATQQAEEPFVWGAGGSRLTVDQLAAKQKIAEQLMKSNYSPVGSVWEGLGRVVDNVSGALDSRSLDKEARAQSASRDQIAQALLGGNNGAAGAAILSGDPGLSKLGELAYAQANPKAPAPLEIERLGQLAGLTPEQIRSGAGQAFTNRIDPFTNLVVGGNSVMGRQSLVEQSLGGGGQTTPSGPDWLSAYTPEEIQQMQGLAASRRGASSIPSGSPLSGAAGTKTVGGKQYWNIGGEWYDNPEGR